MIYFFAILDWASTDFAHCWWTGMICKRVHFWRNMNGNPSMDFAYCLTMTPTISARTRPSTLKFVLANLPSFVPLTIVLLTYYCWHCCFFWLPYHLPPLFWSGQHTGTYGQFCPPCSTCFNLYWWGRPIWYFSAWWELSRARIRLLRTLQPQFCHHSFLLIWLTGRIIDVWLMYWIWICNSSDFI